MTLVDTGTSMASSGAGRPGDSGMMVVDAPWFGGCNMVRALRAMGPTDGWSQSEPIRVELAVLVRTADMTHPVGLAHSCADHK